MKMLLLPSILSSAAQRSREWSAQCVEGDGNDRHAYCAASTWTKGAMVMLLILQAATAHMAPRSTSLALSLWRREGNKPLNGMSSAQEFNKGLGEEERYIETEGYGWKEAALLRVTNCDLGDQLEL